MTKNKLEKLGFKKIPGTEPGFHMYELTPARAAGPAAGKRKVKEEFYWRYIYARTAKRPSAQAGKRTSLQAHKLDK
jgi:hypothetical protein